MKFVTILIIGLNLFALSAGAEDGATKYSCTLRDFMEVGEITKANLGTITIEVTANSINFQRVDASKVVVVNEKFVVNDRNTFDVQAGLNKGDGVAFFSLRVEAFDDLKRSSHLEIEPQDSESTAYSFSALYTGGSTFHGDRLYNPYYLNGRFWIASEEEYASSGNAADLYIKRVDDNPGDKEVLRYECHPSQ